jgi:hypothetical protein
VPPGRRPTGGTERLARGTPRPRRQRSLPRRRCLYGSGVWRGGEETEGGRRGGISRSGISAGKKRARKFPLPARARHSSRRRQRFAPARAARARPRRNEGRGRAARARRERGENGRRSPGSQLGHQYQTRGNDPAGPGRPFLACIKHAL